MENAKVTVATATEMQNNFGKYLKMVMEGQQILVTKNGKEVARFLPKEETVQSLTSQMTGIFPDDTPLEDEKRIISESVRKKHAPDLD